MELGRTFSVAFGSPAHHDRALSQQYYALALPLSEASCNQGDADACERAAFAYGAGFGVAPDSAKADTLRARAIALARARRP